MATPASVKFPATGGADDNIKAGMNPAEARRAALIKLGGMEQTVEECREHRGIPSLEHVLQDLQG